VIVSLAGGELTGLLRDQQRAVFDLGAVTRFEVTAPQSGKRPPSSAELASATDKLFDLVKSKSVSIVLDAHGNDGPRIGVFDPSGALRDLAPTRGRSFGKDDFLSRDVRIMIRSGSYLEKQTATAMNSGLIPRGSEVIGQYDGSKAPFDADYLYNLFSADVGEGSWYVRASDRNVEGIQSALASIGYVVQPIRTPTPAQYVQSTSAATEIESMLGLVAVSLVLVVFDLSVAGRGRWRVMKLFGATPLRIGRDQAAWIALLFLVGLSVGSVGSAALIGLWSPNLVAAPLVILIGDAGALMLAFAASVLFFTFASRSTSLTK